jgi:hypothetical protein
VLEELSATRGLHKNFDAAFERFAAMMDAAAADQAGARGFAQSFVTLAQASLLLGAAMSAGNRSRAAVAEGYCATRLSGEPGWGAVFGASAAAMDVGAILDRAWHE